MKNFFFFLIMLMATNVSAQLVSMLPLNEKGEIYRAEVFEYPSAQKQEIYSAAKQYFADLFLMPQFAIKHSDSITGIIVLRSSKAFSANISSYPMHYSMKLQMKDEKIKIEVYDIKLTKYHFEPSYYFKEKNFFKRNGKPKKFYQNMLDGFLTGLDELFTDTNNGIKSNFNTEW